MPNAVALPRSNNVNVEPIKCQIIVNNVHHKFPDIIKHGLTFLRDRWPKLWCNQLLSVNCLSVNWLINRLFVLRSVFVVGTVGYIHSKPITVQPAFKTAQQKWKVCIVNSCGTKTCKHSGEVLEMRHYHTIQILFYHIISVLMSC